MDVMFRFGGFGFFENEKKRDMFLSLYRVMYDSFFKQKAIDENSIDD